MQSINPATGHKIQCYTPHSAEQVEHSIHQSHETFLAWKSTDFSHRAALMKKAAQVLRKNKEKYALTITQEMGKVLKESVAEVEKCALVCDYYAENAESFLADESIKTDASESFVTYQPIGCVLAVMPWNFPFWQVFRFAAPTLMAGNVGLLKHASNVSGCALAIKDVFNEADFPEGAFRTLLMPSSGVEAVIRHPLIRAVTLTGSLAAGQSVASIAGSCIKKSVLELGGSDPYIILEDANLEKAADACVKSRLINAGQSCIAAKRFIVVEAIYDTFVEIFTAKMKATRMGDPMDSSSDIGPQSSAKLRDELHKQVTNSIAKGANCLIGGEIPKDKGSYYPPTVLVGITEDMPAYSEELFGPVAAIIRAKDEADAIRIANATSFGLGSAVFTNNITRGKRIAAQEIDSGACFVNNFVKSDPRLPFGGIKESGYGRELGSIGIKEFVNMKTVSVA